VKRQKNDMGDAEAICEAVTRANMRFVPIKTPKQQSGLVLHRTRHLFIRQQTAVINAIRAHLAEFGIVAPVGRKGVEELLRVVADVLANSEPSTHGTKQHGSCKRAGSDHENPRLERAPNVLRGHSADSPCRGWIVSLDAAGAPVRTKLRTRT